MATIIMKVDLDCRSCYKKISKTVCKLQERGNIETVTFDDKNNTVTVSGPFDAKKMRKKLCCKAGDVIKEIQIKEKEKEKPKDTKPAEPKSDKPKEDKPKEKPKEDKPKEKPKEDKPKEDKPKEDKPKEDKPKQLEPAPPPPEPVSAEPVYVAQEPQLGYQPAWPGPGCGCGCRPWFEGYYGDYKCPWCGRGGWVPECPPPVTYAPPPYGGYNKTCYFVCEEDPQSSCTIM